MNKIENIVEDLKALPSERLESVLDYIHRLKTLSADQRSAIITRTAGSLTQAEGDDLARIIREGCEQVDGRGR